jgi:glycerol-3-phosphate dehydrogenase (NAD(P)+)
MKITVLGAGAWGTALGLTLSANQHSVTLWGHREDHLDEIRRTRRNERALPGIDLPEWRCEKDIARALDGAEAVVVAVPSKVFRPVIQQAGDLAVPIISVTKGIEHQSGLTMSQILRECAPRAPVAALSGPTFAMEVVRGFPSAIVAASPDADLAETVQQLFHRPSFRVYRSADITGVELGGALKNVIAIAAGVGDGLGFGDNSKAALVTRALAEMRRLGIACGAQAETFAGLSGLGDLTVTCFSRLSRNRAFGERLGRGENPESISKTAGSLAEGYPTARSAYQLARRLDAETPIIDEVYAMLYEGKNVEASLHDLTTRSSKAETL